MNSSSLPHIDQSSKHQLVNKKTSYHSPLYYIYRHKSIHILRKKQKKAKKSKNRRAFFVSKFLFCVLHKFFPFIKADEIAVVCDLAEFEVQFVFLNLAHLVSLCVVVCHKGILSYISTTARHIL